jgi:hypothetical protein
MTTDEQTFKVDNFFIQAAPGLIGAKPVQLSLPYPGQEPFSKFDFWVAMGCYSLVNPKNPKEPVVVSLTQFVEILDFAKTVARSSDGYSRMTYTSDAYAQVKESLHRLFSVEVNLRGEYLVRVKTKGKRQRRPVEYHGRLLASYMYIYPADVMPPDQLPEAKRRNVNEAKTQEGRTRPACMGTGRRGQARRNPIQSRRRNASRADRRRPEYRVDHRTGQGLQVAPGTCPRGTRRRRPSWPGSFARQAERPRMPSRQPGQVGRLRRAQRRPQSSSASWIL